MTTWNLQGTKHHIFICNGSSCMRKGGEEATQAIRNEITNLDLESFIHTTRTRCNGRCKDAPVVIVYPEGTWYKEVTPEVGSNLIRNGLAAGNGFSTNVIYQYGQDGFVAPERTGCVTGISKTSKRSV
ncbi:ferredoxin [Bacillus sp. V5-8f]|uniref:(2Fe-2S) ferredoxin domain-containing protein n=1 Tax=Bacillus sp. V5-8f TaxID=2053044 RepID=UPI000C75E844|nr:(2Fe-2S) ferredoxin domain-containing protein [Bacillus sp. V5-8f]PLT33174.1 2Fe-2S ferredoxin [Bacillus sp. V5-8f]